MEKTINHIVTAIGFFALLSLLTACGEELFERTYVIEKPRVIAIKAESPEIDVNTPPDFPALVNGFPVSVSDFSANVAAGDAVYTKISALAIDPAHGPFTYTWTGGGVLAEEMPDFQVAYELGVPLLPIGRETIFKIPVTENYAAGFEQRQQIFSGLLLESGSLKLATKSVYLSDNRQANRNPIVEPIELNGNERFFSPGQKITAECKMSDPDDEDPTDRLRRNWYIERGELDTSLKQRTVWELPGGIGIETIYCVGRDLRGGVDWQRQDIFIGEANDYAIDTALAGVSYIYLVESEDGFILPVGINDETTAATAQDALDSEAEILLGGVAVPEAEMRYNFFFDPSELSISEAMPDPGTATTSPAAPYDTSVADIESMASTALLMQNLSEQDADNITAAFDTDTVAAESAEMFDQLINGWFSGTHYIKARVLQRIEFN